MKPRYNTEWKRILNEIYTSGDQYCRGIMTDVKYINSHPLAKKLGMTRHDLERHIWFLQDNDLIKRGDRWELTDKGFDVSIQNEKIKRDTTTQYVFLAISVISLAIAVMMLVITVIDKFL